MDRPVVICFRVNGRPAPQGSKAISRTGHLYEMSKQLKPWRTAVTLTARAHGVQLLDGPVALGMEFVMPRPKGTSKSKPTPPAMKRPDVDKLARAVCDALTDECFRDDSQITVMPLLKRIAEPGEEPGVKVLVAPCEPVMVVAILANLFGFACPINRVE